MIAKLLNKALKETDVNAIRTLATLAGADGGILSLAEDASVETIDAYQSIYIPNNGRDTFEPLYLTPQPGPQTAFMCSSADIVIYGGAAGGGKTFALLLEGLRHKDIAGFSGVVFRKIILKSQLQAVCGMLLTKYMDKCKAQNLRKLQNYIGFLVPAEQEFILRIWSVTKICKAGKAQKSAI